MEDGLLVPVALRASHAKYFGNATTAWIRSLPDQVSRWRQEWQLRLDGTPQSGAVALVLPVLRADGTPAVLKLQPVDDETQGEPIALACWGGDGAVRLLERDPATGSLASMPEARAISMIAGLLRHLNRVPAPPILRRLDDIANRIVADSSAIAARTVDAEERSLVAICTARLAELITEPVAGRLLHWDLHYDNVLARPGDEEVWVAIDPKPLAGDPGFELLPALWNRWAEVTATGDIRRALLRRFDLMIEVQGLEGERAAVWTLARVLQNALWDMGRLGQARLNPAHRRIAEALLSRYP